MSPSIIEWFEEQVASRPDAPALTSEGQRWTYRELHRDLERVAASFRDLGIRKGDTIAIYCKNHPTTIVNYLAAARIGAVPSAINFMFKQAELSWVVGQLAAKVVVTDQEHLEVAKASVDAVGLDVPVFLVDGEAEGTRPWSDLLRGEGDPGPRPGRDDDFEILYTSGTTGNPKGAVFDNASMLYQLQSWRDYCRLVPEETWYVTTPLFHTAGMRYGALVALLTGAHVVLPDGFHPATFWKEIVENEVTFFVIVETIGIILLQMPESDEERRHRVPRILTAGHRELLKQLEERFGFVTIQAYGMTEIGIVLATDPFGDTHVEQRRRDWNPGWNYVGFPMAPRTEIRIVDDDGDDVPDGQLGEIAVRSPGTMKDYLGTPEGGRPIIDGWLRTGDLGARAPDGAFYFADRAKDMIRRSGENIASKQIEEAIEDHSGIVDVAVYPVPDPVRVQEVKALCVRAPDSNVTADEIWAWCAERLAEFKVPRYVEFRDQIPKNPVGRFLKATLREEPIAGQGETYDRMTGERVEPARS
ncbi:MAG: acyl--CoA ligase [Acidimicrobiia bacterium]|nr:acyl--CoA ligase [Acidimicrobiia bacterium]